ncbi:MAG: MFS transporter [Chloroflexota bacterium]
MQHPIETNQSRRNFWLGVLNGTFYITGETLMEPTLVLASFVSRLTDSPLWIGMIVPLRDGSWFLPQLWVSSFLQSEPRKLPYYRNMALVRALPWLAMTLVVLTVRDPLWMMIIFFACFSVTAIAAGLSGLPFLEVISKTIPPERRGEFFALRLATGGLAGVGASFFVRWMLDEKNIYTFPANFGVLFGTALALACASWLVFAWIVEPGDQNVKPPVSLIDQLRRAIQIIKSDPRYRRFIYLRSSLIVGGAATPFFAVYVQRTLDGSLSMIGVYLAVYVITNLVTNFALARISGKIGYQRVTEIAALAGLTMTLVVLILILIASPLNLRGTIPSLWLIPVFILSGIRESSQGVAGQSLLLEIAPLSERTLYLGFTNTLLGIILLTTGLSGIIVQTFGLLTLLIIAILAHILALVSSARMRKA